MAFKDAIKRMCTRVFYLQIVVIRQNRCAINNIPLNYVSRLQNQDRCTDSLKCALCRQFLVMILIP